MGKTRLVGPLNSGAAVGDDGAATANADTLHQLAGRLKAIRLKYNDSPPAGTTDVVVKTVGTSPAAPSTTLLSLANAATDGIWYPRAAICTTSGSALTTYDEIPISDLVNVSIDGANAGDSVDAWLFLED